MGALGYSADWNGVLSYVEDIRVRFDTLDVLRFLHEISSRHFAYASIGGPRLVMDYNNDGWGPTTSTEFSSTRRDTSSVAQTSTRVAGATAAVAGDAMA